MWNRRRFLKTAALGALGTAASARVLLRAASSAARSRPNLLLVFPDELRFDWTALTPGQPVRTPNLVRLAEEGIRFDQAFCPTPLCAPSRACLATGRAYGRTGVATNKDNLPGGAATFYSLLRDAGYQVGSAGKLDLRKPSHDWGPDGMHRVDGHVYFREWGFTAGLDSEGKGDSLKGGKLRESVGPYMKMLRDRADGSLEAYLQWWSARKESRLEFNHYSYTEPVRLDDSVYNDNWVGRQGLDLLSTFTPGQPWFLQVNFPGPHPPMDVTRAMAAWYRGTSFRAPLASTQLEPAVHQAIRRNYSAMVENIDRWLGRYLDALERRGELENTLVVFSSDHGEMLGDHNLWGKRAPLQPSVCVPLVIRGPDVRRRTVHPGPATTLDLTATFLDYAGAARPAEMDSRSLRQLLRGEGSARSTVTAGFGRWRLASDGRYKLIRGFDAVAAAQYGDRDDDPSGGSLTAAAEPVMLFDLEKDPGETTDLSSQKPDLVAHLAKFLPTT